MAWYSAGFNGATGNLTGGKSWLTSAALDSAAARHCFISAACVQSQDSRNIDSLLRDPSAQHELDLEILETLGARHAAGVNLLFDDMPPNSATALTAFIKQLAAILKGRGAHSYQLGIRIPAYATEDKYDLPALNQYVDRFWVDFTQYRRNDPAPLAPLAGVSNNDLGTCLSRYVNMPLPASKLMVCLPYFGVRWTWRSGKWVGARPISYKDIRSHAYQQLPVYDPLSATERIDFTNRSGTLTERLWYDDEVSLAAKFEFIRQNNLGGIVIDSLGDDDGYGDLWDVRTAELSGIDTTVTSLRIKGITKQPLDDWQWSWTYINAKLEQYIFLFAYPRETEFPRVLIRKWEKVGVRNNNRSLIRKRKPPYSAGSSTLAVLSAAALFLLINRIRHVGETWKWTKTLAAVLIALFILLVISAFMYLFLNTHVVFFGASEDASDCFDFPLGALFVVVFIGIAFRILITRFLIFRLMRKDDTP